MKTRSIVSALVIATLSLGSVSSFAQGYGRGDGHERFEQRANGAGWQGAYQRGQDRRVAQAQGWRGQREWRDHEHERHGYYAQPVYSYQQPVYSYQPPVYYGQYAEPNAAADVVLGAIVGGVIGQAIANH